MKYLKHTVVDMDEGVVQRCVKCSEVICDYHGTMSPDGYKPKGFAAGEVYVSIGSNPQITTSYLGDDEEAFDCLTHTQK
jgi:hypothetical protein